jgi:hypothetical protein
MSKKNLARNKMSKSNLQRFPIVMVNLTKVKMSQWSSDKYN